MIVRDLFWRYSAMVNSKSFQRANSQVQNLLRVDLIADLSSRLFNASTGFMKLAEDAARFQDGLKFLKASGGDLDALRKKTRNLVDDMKLLQYVNLADTFGINNDQLAQAVIIADAAAKKLVMSQDHALESLMKGLSRARNTWTDNIGIIVGEEKVAIEAQRLFGRKAKTEEEKRQAFIAAALKQGGRLYTKSALELGATASDMYDNLTTATNNFKLRLGMVFNRFIAEQGPRIIDTLESITDALEKMSKVDTKWIDRILSFAKAAAALFVIFKVATVVVPLVTSALTTMLMAVAYGTTIVGGLGLAFKSFMLPALAFAAAIIAIDEVMASLDDDRTGFFEEFFAVDTSGFNDFIWKIKNTTAAEWGKSIKQLASDTADWFIDAFFTVGEFIKYVVRAAFESVGLLDFANDMKSIMSHPVDYIKKAVNEDDVAKEQYKSVTGKDMPWYTMDPQQALFDAMANQPVQSALPQSATSQSSSKQSIEVNSTMNIQLSGGTDDQQAAIERAVRKELGNHSRDMTHQIIKKLGVP